LDDAAGPKSGFKIKAGRQKLGLAWLTCRYLKSRATGGLPNVVCGSISRRDTPVDQFTETMHWHGLGNANPDEDHVPLGMLSS